MIGVYFGKNFWKTFRNEDFGFDIISTYQFLEESQGGYSLYYQKKPQREQLHPACKQPQLHRISRISQDECSSSASGDFQVFKV